MLTVDDRRVTLRPSGRALITHPMGQGGLRTTRVELPLTAPIDGRARVELRDDTFAGRVGWRAIVPQPGRGTAVRANVPAGDPTDGLRRYPEDLLNSPADIRAASLDAAPGTGTLTAPDGARTVAGTEPGRADDGFTKAFSDAAAGEGVLLLLLLAALGWGAVHALSPGHGKAMVAAYLVGTRGRPRHAVALGAIVTVTHTAGVFALGAITLALSEFVLPETLYPWLNLVSGLLVVAIGATVLRGHLRRHRAHDARITARTTTRITTTFTPTTVTITITRRRAVPGGPGAACRPSSAAITTITATTTTTPTATSRKSLASVGSSRWARPPD